MTATYDPVRTAPATPAVADGVAARREALTALDSFVRPLLQERLRLPFGLVPPSVELSVYDEIYRRSSAGGHWTVSTRWTNFLTHTIAAYTVALHFDASQRPAFFRISGAREVDTESATPEALARGLQQAALGGPLITWAPNMPPSISL